MYVVKLTCEFSFWFNKIYGGAVKMIKNTTDENNVFVYAHCDLHLTFNLNFRVSSTYVIVARMET